MVPIFFQHYVDLEDAAECGDSQRVKEILDKNWVGEDFVEVHDILELAKFSEDEETIKIVKDYLGITDSDDNSEDAEENDTVVKEDED
jgi:hypothetical protein